MSVISVFRSYLEENHPHLVVKDWKVDVKVVSLTDIQNAEIRATIPSEITGEITCWKFFYDGGAPNIVYLIQDKQGVQDIEIVLVSEGELIKPVIFIEAVDK